METAGVELRSCVLLASKQVIRNNDCDDQIKKCERGKLCKKNEKAYRLFVVKPERKRPSGAER